MATPIPIYFSTVFATKTKTQNFKKRKTATNSQIINTSGVSGE